MTLDSYTKYTVGYGAKVRKQHTHYLKASKSKYPCVSCGGRSLRRVRSGLWGCKVCKLQLTGNSYYPN